MALFSRVKDGLENLLFLNNCHHTEEHYEQRHERHCLQKRVAQLLTSQSHPRIVTLIDRIQTAAAQGLYLVLFCETIECRH